jgi:hypothetical protein
MRNRPILTQESESAVEEAFFSPSAKYLAIGLFFVSMIVLLSIFTFGIGGLGALAMAGMAASVNAIGTGATVGLCVSVMAAGAALYSGVCLAVAKGLTSLGGFLKNLFSSKQADKPPLPLSQQKELQELEAQLAAEQAKRMEMLMVQKRPKGRMTEEALIKEGKRQIEFEKELLSQKYPVLDAVNPPLLPKQQPRADKLSKNERVQEKELVLQLVSERNRKMEILMTPGSPSGAMTEEARVKQGERQMRFEKELLSQKYPLFSPQRQLKVKSSLQRKNLTITAPVTSKQGAAGTSHRRSPSQR